MVSVWDIRERNQTWLQSVQREQLVGGSFYELQWGLPLRQGWHRFRRRPLADAQVEMQSRKVHSAYDLEFRGEAATSGRFGIISTEISRQGTG